MPNPAAAPLPPQNLDAEESVLGAMMLSVSAIDAVVEIVAAPDFYRASHARIFTACVDLHNADRAVDAITVADYLEEQGILAEIGGKERIHEIATLVPATSNAGHYARIVREMAALRGLTLVGEQIQRLGWERPGPADELVEQAEGLVFSLGRDRQREDFVVVKDTLADTFRRLEELTASGAEVIGLPTGFRPLDVLTSGLQPGNLIVLAGRPSMGKSALALCICANVTIRTALPAALFTLEMSRAEVTQRLLAIEGLVQMGRIRNGRMDREEYERVLSAGARIDKAPLFIDDSGMVTMSEVRSKARRLKLRHPDLALVVVDYLQLMSSGTAADNKAEHRVQVVSQISRSLKVLAGELEVPVLALSQLSRQVESRHDKRPILSDLRESGSIEQDADIVAFVYRDEYYNPEEIDQQGIAEVALAKHRNGPTETVKLSFLKKYARFGELARPGAGDPA